MWLVALVLTAVPPIDYLPPERVSVLPVCFVAADQPAPTDDQLDRLTRHLAWAQRRYRELLDGVDTFTIADGPPLVHAGSRELAFYRESGEGGAPQYVAELLEALGVNRFTCPHVLLVVVMNPADGFPGGGGRPLNGGYNNGGGVVILSSHDLDRAANFQSTLQHELGHAFGLVHVDAYGFDMAASPSIMSYNPAHHTRGFEPSATPGILSPEDRRGLALNHRAFPRLDLVPDAAEPPRWLGPMSIPAQPSYRVRVETDAESLYSTRPEQAVQGLIEPSEGPEVRFNPATMWHSGDLADGWARLELEFPVPVALDRLRLYTEHSGRYHRAHAVRLEALDEQVVELAAARVDSPAADLIFAPTTSQRWRLSLRAGPSRQICLRGLRFFAGETELFAPVRAPD